MRRQPGAQPAVSRLRNLPVDSIATSTPCSAQASFSGSRTALTATLCPSTMSMSSLHLDRLGERAEGAVVAQQAGQGQYIGDVVDGDDLDVVVVGCITQVLAADAPEAIDAHADCHC